MPSVTITPSACNVSGGWQNLYYYLTRNSDYWPRQLLFTYPTNSEVGAVGVKITKLTIHGYVRNSSTAIKRMQFGFRPSAGSGVAEWATYGGSSVLDGTFQAIDRSSGGKYIYQTIERIYTSGSLFVNYISEQFQQGKPVYLGVIQPEEKSIQVYPALANWSMTIDYELLGNIPSTESSEVKLGEALTVNVNRVVGNSTTALTFKIGDAVIHTADIGTDATYSYTIPSSAGAYFSTTTSTTLTIEAATSLDGAPYGTLTTSIKLSVPDDAAPVFDFAIPRKWIDGIPAEAQVGAYVQWLTKAGIMLRGGSRYGTSNAELRIAIEGRTYIISNPSGQDAVFDIAHVLTTYGEVPVTLTLVDARGISTTRTKTLDVLPWANPQAQVFNVDRATSEGTYAVDGTYALATVQASASSIILSDAEQNSLKFKIQYRKIIDDSRNLYSGSDNFSGNNWENLSEWTMDGAYQGHTVMKRTGAWYGLSQTIALRANRNYILSAYMKQSTGGSVEAYFRYTEESPATTPTYQPVEVGTDWSYVSVPFKVNVSGDLKPRFEQSVEDATLWIAGLSVVEVSGEDSSDWIDCDEITSTSLSESFSGLLTKDGVAIDDLDDMSGYEFRLALTDRFVTAYAFAQIATRDVYIDINEETGNMGFGGAAPDSDEAFGYRFHKRVDLQGGYKVYKRGEVDTGNLWYNDKPIYRTIIAGTTSLSGAGETVYTLSAVPSDIVDLRAYVKTGDGIFRPIPWTQSNANMSADLYITGDGVYLTFGSGWSGERSYVIIIEYTK